MIKSLDDALTRVRRVAQLQATDKHDEHAEQLLQLLLNAGFHTVPASLYTIIPVSRVNEIWETYHRRDRRGKGRPKEHFTRLTRQGKKDTVMMTAMLFTQRRIVEIFKCAEPLRPQRKPSPNTNPNKTPVDKTITLNSLVMFWANAPNYGIAECPGCRLPTAWIHHVTACVQCKAAERTIRDQEEVIRL